ncbi:TRAP transporter large permease [Nocardiopsis coralli]|nr:TRAP transporter large permease [Nocardiopsis coralli]
MPRSEPADTRAPGTPTAPTGTARRRWPARVVPLAAIAVCAVLILGPFTPGTVGGASVALMLVLVLAKVPLGAALAVPGIAGLYGLYGAPAVVNVLARLPFDTVASWEFSVIPMFVFMGLLLWKAGVTEQLYTALRGLVGWMPGGLAVVTNAAGAGLASVSGSTVGTVHALARIGVPEMLRAGYDKRLAVGSVVAAGLPGQVIPPSIFLVIYAGLAQVPVGPQLIAGIAPGVLLALCMAGTVVVLCTVRPSMGGRRGRPGDVFAPATRAALRLLWPLPLLIGVVLGSMYTGVVTVTEAGAVGALGAVLIALWCKRGDRPLATVGLAAVDALKAMGTIFFLFVGAMAMAQVLAVSGIGPGFSAWVTGMGLGRVGFLLLVMAAFLVMGMFMDPLSMMLVTVPLLVPALGELGISPLWFGVFVVVLAELAIVTPPVGVLTFIVQNIVERPEVGLGRDIRLGDTFRGVALFLPTVVLVCVLLILFPEIATFLPDSM